MTTSEQARPAAQPPDSPLAGLEFVVVDVETTGWLPDQAVITEIGAVRVGLDGTRAEFTALVNPGSAIPADIAALTGITDEMVGQAPPIAEIMPAFLGFARGGVLAAHNAPFDVGFLTAACQRSGLRWPEFSVLDTAALARLVLAQTEVPDRRLGTLAAYFGATTLPCHRALPDAKATADVLLCLLSRLAAAGVLTLNCQQSAQYRRQAPPPAAAGSADGTLTPAAGDYEHSTQKPSLQEQNLQGAGWQGQSLQGQSLQGQSLQGQRRRQWSPQSSWSKLMSRASRRPARRSLRSRK